MINRLFHTKNPLILGVDIGAHTVKAVLLSQHGAHYKVEAFAIEPMIKGSINEREIQDIEAVGNVISKIRKKIPKSVKFAAAAVSGSTVISKVIFMDANLSDNELASQIEVEADSLIPYPLSEVSMDFEKQDLNLNDPSKVNVLLSAARTESVQTRVSALDQGGFTAKVIDVESYALSRAAELCYKQLPADAKSKLVAVVDIGATMTLLSIMEGGKVLYTRDQMFGGEQYTRSIVSYYGKTYEEAEQAKVGNDLPPNYTFEVLAPFQTMLLQQVRRGIQMYLTTSGRDNIDYLLISGGTSMIEGVDKLLTDELGIHTVVANPFLSMDTAASIDRELLNQVAPQLMVASGLALREFFDMAYINLLPWREAQRKQQQTQFMTLLSMAGIFSFAAVFGLSAVYGAKIEGQDSRNNYLQGEITVLEQRIVEIRELDEKKKNLQKRMELISQLQSSRNLGTQIMDEIAAVVPAGVYLSNLQKQGPSLLLVGKSESNNRLSNMIRSVESSDLLKDPLLEFIEAGKDQSQILSDFKIHLTVKGFEAVQGEAKPAAPQPGTPAQGTAK